MKVQLISKTEGAGVLHGKSMEEIIVHNARVSSSREDKTSDYSGLINYCIKNKHWSIFEHGFITFEIETSKAIGIQLLRHRSFTFQEFSQRYQDVGKVSDDDMFEPIELRKQAITNRQSSEEVFDPIVEGNYDTIQEDSVASYLIGDYLKVSEELYQALLDSGVAKEQARLILPMCTKTKIYMTGSVRSWIHFLEIRDDAHAQKEIQLIAKELKNIFKEELPIISQSLNFK